MIKKLWPLALILSGCASAPTRGGGGLMQGGATGGGGSTVLVPSADSRPSIQAPAPRGRLAVVLSRKNVDPIDIYVPRYPRPFPIDVSEAILEDAKSAYGAAFESVDSVTTVPRAGYDYVIEPELTDLRLEANVASFGLATQFTLSAAVRATLTTIDGAPLWVHEARSSRYGGNWPSMWTGSAAEISQKAFPPLTDASGKAVSDALKKSAEELFRKGIPGTPAARVAQAAPAAVPAAPRAPRSDVDELPAAGPRRAGHAVIIGVESYREKLPKADYAAADAKLVAEYAKRVLGIPEENVAVLSNDRATRGDFEKYFERWLPNRVEAGDEVFVYYSGHGAPDPKTGEAFLVPYDADPTYIKETGYPIKRLYENLSKLKAKRVTLAMDSCFSGSGGRSVIAKGARPLVGAVTAAVPAQLTVLSASGGDQVSNSYEEKGHGLFTYFLLKGLKQKGGDLKAAFEYLKPEVSRVARREYNADQTPEWRGK
jgi:hypothetical protein